MNNYNIISMILGLLCAFIIGNNIKKNNVQIVYL